MSNILTLCDFSVYRNEITLFDPISLTLKGQAYEIRGQNGIGKTSLLETISGLKTTFKGQFSLFTSQIYISRRAPFNQEETLLKNLSFWAHFWKTPTLLSKALQTWGITHLSHLPYKRLSQGQQQRASLARLSLKKASLWLLDEPTANLDQQSIDIFQGCLKAHLQEGGSALIATHHPLNLAQHIRLRPQNRGGFPSHTKAVA